MVNLEAVTIKTKRNWVEFEKALRGVTLNSDKSIMPYKNAKISSKIVSFDEIYPISYYVLAGHIEVQQKLHDLFWQKYKINTLNLDGDRPNLTFQVTGEKGEWSISPPIVEVSVADGGKQVLLDGEHRFMLARKLDQKIRVVWIENVPKEYPPVSYPITWKEVKTYYKVPKLTSKKNYRFKSLSEFPDISTFSRIQIAEQDCRYFFYRDLTNICTSSIRKEGTS